MQISQEEAGGGGDGGGGRNGIGSGLGGATVPSPSVFSVPALPCTREVKGGRRGVRGRI